MNYEEKNYIDISCGARYDECRLGSGSAKLCLPAARDCKCYATAHSGAQEWRRQSRG